ncbi:MULTISPECIES: DUF6544 family protein [unclassified Sedimentibacter]|uniref:DUF6544 family protein n=1 Tax=unclassified Sedimentibacter TaxID=2649220 RepID=UPI0027E14F81|nr:DUF6544 family protein [Sedimentibacter sp. MB35-C1]WMJ76840.1 hypothetical protein RBQ61_14865 [Sedimentibacter sp. MB35-C1]
MWYLLLSGLFVIVLLILFLYMPYSKTKKEFNNVIENRVKSMSKTLEVFTENDMINLPEPVQKYFKKCGYIGKPKMSYMKAYYKNVNFKMSPSKTIKIDHTQCNFVKRPERFAFINSNLYGIPFEGLDSYDCGIGRMKGVIAKIITLFDQRGAEMDRACLVTYLSESLIFPNAALQDFITWKEIDSTHAEAEISCYGISASGVFTFDEDGLWRSFRTNDRISVSMDGSERKAPWSAIVEDYHQSNEIWVPRVVSSVWHYPEGDFIYFNENGSKILIEHY